MTSPLEGIRILDLTQVQAGPSCTQLLAWMGADVIKIEPPQGSSSRNMAPFLEDATEMEQILRFFSYNRNKRGITLDLQSEPGRQALMALVEKPTFL